MATIKLTLREIRAVNEILTIAPKVDADGKPQLKTYGGKDYSAVRWFKKNTKKIFENWAKLIEDEQTKRKEEKKDDIEAEKKIREAVTKLVKDAAETEKKDLQEKLAAILNFAFPISVEQKINIEIDKDEAIIKKFTEEEHDVEVTDATIAVIKKELSEHEFNYTDESSDTVLTKFGL